MSRSYKQHPWCTDGRNGQKIGKRFANKAVRRYKDKIPKGKWYKRLFCSWDIHDYVSRWSWEDAKWEYEHNPWPHWLHDYPTLQDFYKFWSKYYKRK